MRAPLVLFLTARFLSAAYSNLIATSDGKSVYFQVATGPVTDSWYVAREPGRIEAVARPLADLNGAGTIDAWSYSYPRVCGFAGSSCWLADPCQAAYGIEGMGISQGNTRYETFVRLNPSGAVAWIDQKSCAGIGSVAPPLSGLYTTDTLRLLVASAGAQLANQRYGRRVITDSARALTLAGPQLQWLDASGKHLIRNVYGAQEAVTDAAGANVVYVEAGTGRLHWLTGPDWLGAKDDNLLIKGTAPALTPDGSALLFLGADGALQIYTRLSNTIRVLAKGRFLSFSATADAAFAVTLPGKLIRIDLATGSSADWLAPFPGIQSVDALPRSGFVPVCPHICYTPEDVGRFASPGMLMVLHGDSLGQTGWRARTPGVETPLLPVSSAEAWFQLPIEMSSTGDLQTLEIYNANHPIRYSMQIEIRPGVPVCLAAVTAVSRGIAHIYLTGLKGTETIPDLVPNPLNRLIPVADPPPLSDTLQSLFFGLAPGLIGVQQLDVRVLSPTADIFATPYAYHCSLAR